MSTISHGARQPVRLPFMRNPHRRGRKAYALQTCSTLKVFESVAGTTHNVRPAPRGRSSYGSASFASALISFAALSGCGTSSGRAPGSRAGGQGGYGRAGERTSPSSANGLPRSTATSTAQIQPASCRLHRHGRPTRKAPARSQRRASSSKLTRVPFQAGPRSSQGAAALKPRLKLGKTKLDVDRDTPLAKERAMYVAQSQLDNDIHSKFGGGRRRSVPTKAQVEQAQLNLGFTHVTSLVDGIAGIAQVQIGQHSSAR